jgi:hypothetical protein
VRASPRSGSRTLAGLLAISRARPCDRAAVDERDRDIAESTMVLS